MAAIVVRGDVLVKRLEDIFTELQQWVDDSNSNGYNGVAIDKGIITVRVVQDISAVLGYCVFFIYTYYLEEGESGSVIERYYIDDPYTEKIYNHMISTDLPMFKIKVEDKITYLNNNSIPYFSEPQPVTSFPENLYYVADGEALIEKLESDVLNSEIDNIYSILNSDRETVPEAIARIKSDRGL